MHKTEILFAQATNFKIIQLTIINNNILFFKKVAADLKKKLRVKVKLIIGKIKTGIYVTHAIISNIIKL